MAEDIFERLAACPGIESNRQVVTYGQNHFRTYYGEVAHSQHPSSHVGEDFREYGLSEQEQFRFGINDERVDGFEDYS